MPTITTADLKMLYDDGKLKFAAEPDGDTPICWIGDCWFYFAGAEGDEAGAEAYYANTPVDDLLDELADTLEGFKIEESLSTEYAYYAAIVRMQLLVHAKEVDERAGHLREAASFLAENEQYGDDWGDPIAALDASIAELDAKQDALLASSERFDEVIKRQLAETGEYAECPTQRCPKCGELKDVCATRFDGEGGRAWQHVTCNKCGCTYDEVYLYYGTEVRDD